MKVEFRYRDASNYKDFFEVEIDLNKYPEAKTLQVGDDIEMGQYGTMRDTEFFGSDIHPASYDLEYDHNILEVSEILN